MDSSLRDAASDGKLRKVRSLFRKGANMNAPDKSGDTALSLACKYGHTRGGCRIVEPREIQGGCELRNGWW
jgi:ankyrin repeat protein